MDEKTKRILKESTEVAQTAAESIGGTFEQGVGFTQGVITGNDLTPEEPIQFETVEDTPPFSVAGLAPLELTTPEEEAQSLSEQMQALNEQLLGQSEFRTKQEAEQDITGLTQTQQDLSSQLKGLQAEALAIPIQMQIESEGRARTVGGLRTLTTGRLRENAIRALTVSSLLEASRGNLALAFANVERAVAQRFDPIKERIAVASANLNLALESPAFTLAEKNRAQEQLDIQNTKKAQVERQESNEKEIKNYAIEAVRFGANAEQASFIQEARTPEEALQRASTFLGREFAQEIEQKQFNQNLKALQYELSLDKFNEDVRQFNEKQALDNQKIILLKAQKNIETAEDKNKENEATELKKEMLQGKLNIISNLADHKGLDSRVGPSRFARKLFAVKDKFGAGQEFAGMVHQFIDRETLDMLINVKAQGATFGALQKAELDKLENSASKISFWEVKKDGEPTGQWNIDEESFKREVRVLQDLTEKALNRATGITPLTTEEQIEIDTLLESDLVDITNPANFF